MATVTLDVRDTNCPIPILRAMKTVKEMIPGDVLEISATDDGAPEDFVTFCETTGHTLLENTKAGDGAYLIRIEVI